MQPIINVLHLVVQKQLLEYQELLAKYQRDIFKHQKKEEFRYNKNRFHMVKL